MIKIGIIGLSDKGNGHPFSFSSIINGYSEKGYKKSNYQNILKYGVLRIFPQKNSYFSYLKVLGKELKLNIKLKKSVLMYIKDIRF